MPDVKLVLLVAVALILGAGCGTRQGTAQVRDQGELSRQALESAMNFRRYFLGNDAPFEACSAVAALPEASGFPERLPEHLRSMVLRASGADCEVDGVAVEQERPGELVKVRRVQADGVSAVVELYVRVGSYTHIETYRLLRRDGPGATWRVEEVVMKPGLAI